jgi:cytochrome c peroxidase
MKSKVSAISLGLLGVFISVFSATALSSEGNSGNKSFKELKALYKRPAKIPYPDDNKYSKAREELGKTLFFDPRLSGSNMISCGSCHNPSFSWGDALPKGVGHGHKTLGRRTPTILNLAWTEKLMWDGRANGLEEQALGPIQADVEMNMPLAGDEGLLKKLQSISGYKPLFDRAYPGEGITDKTIAKAIATFERGIVSGEAPFDRFIKGDEKAISDNAKRGFALFNGKAQCFQCHSGWSFSDGSFYDIGVNSDDIGRSKILDTPSMQHAFKTPGLRNVALRHPYMHDGSEKSLEEVIDLYNQGGRVKRASISSLMKPLGLNDGEKQDLVAFLKTLTSKDKAIDLPTLPR